MKDSGDLLRTYAQRKDEEAFTELVNRHLKLVYAAALRQVGEAAYLAEDITQTVFMDLARESERLSQNVIVAGWLYQHTCFVAQKVMRSERRRQSREQKAAEMMDQTPNILPMDRTLDEAMSSLGAKDRTALVLRFFEGQPLRDVGAAMGTSEDAARMRVERALAKLGVLLKRRGVSLSASALATTLATASSAELPLALAKNVTVAALTTPVPVTSFATTLIKFMSSTKLKTAAAIAVIGLGGTGILFQERTLAAMRSNHGALISELAQQDEMRAENDRWKRAVAGNELQNQAQQREELLRLRAQTAALREQLAQQQRWSSLNVARLNAAGLDAPGISFRLSEARNVGARTPMMLLQTSRWAARIGDTNRFNALWVEAPDVSEREKIRGRIVRDRLFRLTSGEQRLRGLESYEEVRLLQETPSDNGTEVRLVTQFRGTAGWERTEVPLMRRVEGEWRFVMLMSPNELTPSIPE